MLHRYDGRVPSLDDLTLAVAAADDPNFGAVAGRRHVSQSTVSRSVQRVEAALGVVLFERPARSVRLRADAEPVVDALRSMLVTWDALLVASAQPRSLRIFCTVTASQTFAADLLAQ